MTESWRAANKQHEMNAPPRPHSRATEKLRRRERTATQIDADLGWKESAKEDEGVPEKGTPNPRAGLGV